MLFSLRSAGDIVNEVFDGSTALVDLRIGTGGATVALTVASPPSALNVPTRLAVALAAAPQTGGVDVSTRLTVALAAQRLGGTLPIGTSLRTDLAQEQQLGEVNISTGLRMDLARDQGTSTLPVGTRLAVDLVQARQPGVVNVPTSLAVALAQTRQPGAVNVATGLRVDLARDQGTSTLPVGTRLAVGLAQERQPGAVNVATRLAVALAREQQPGVVNVPTRMMVALRQALQPGSINVPTSLAVSLTAAPQLGAVDVSTRMTVGLAKAPQPGAVNVSTGLRVDLVRAQAPSTLPVGTSLRVGLAQAQQPGAINVATGLAVALVHERQPGAVNVSTGLQVDLVRDQAPSTLPVGTTLRVGLAQERQLGEVNVGTGLRVSLVRAQLPSTLAIGTKLKVDLREEFSSSSLDIGTGPVTVDLIQAPQPGVVNISTKLKVDLARAQGTSRLPVGTKLQVDLLAAAQPNRVAIGTGPLTVLAKPAAPVRVGTRLTVELEAGQPTSRIKFGTGLNVSLTAAGEAAFGYTRDLVFAAQTDLTPTTVTQPILLGIEFTNQDFRSVANNGHIQQSNAEDVQFNLITAAGATGALLNHNIINHDPVNGILRFDLQLPSWNFTTDVPVRMSYGFVGQVTGKIGISTSVKVALNAPWYRLPIRSNRLSASGTSFWYDRGGTNVPALTALAAEEGDVALIDAMSASSKGATVAGVARPNVSTWAKLIGDPVGVPLATGALNSIDTQFDWRIGTDFGFGHCVNHLPTGGSFTEIGSGWLFWVIQTVPASASTDTGVTADRRRVWDEIIAGDHDAEYIKFGERLATKIDASGHPRGRFVLDANHEMNQSNSHRVFADTRDLYIAAMDRTIQKIRQGAGFRVRFCHRPGFSTDPDASGNPIASIGPYDSFIPNEVDVLAMSLHPGDDVTNLTTVNALLNGTLNANYYGLPDLLAAAGPPRNLPIAFPEFSPKFQAIGLGLCPVADIFMTQFFQQAIVPNRDKLVCDCVWNQNIRDVGAYEGTGSGDTQWDSMVASRKTLWSGKKSANAPVNQTAPHITPTSAVVGVTLSCSQGIWTGTLPITYTYRWRRAGVDIAGVLADDPTYLTVTADVGQAISCRVTASNGVGSPVSEISDNSVTVTAVTSGSDFVLVKTLIGLNRPAAQILRPTDAQLRNNEPGNTNQVGTNDFRFVPNFGAAANQTLDLRGKKFYHHSLNPYGTDTTPGAVSAMRPDGYQNGLVVYGAEVIGEQIDNTVWRTMKSQTPFNPANMDDNALDYIDGSGPADAVLYVEACVFRKSFDGVNTDKGFALNPGSKVRYIVQGCYAEKQRDEFVENDGISYLEIHDCLVDSCHNFVSMRPGNSSPAVPPDYSVKANWVKVYNTLARCRGQYYTTDIGGDDLKFGMKRVPQWEPNNNSVFVARPDNATLAPDTPGWVSPDHFKGDFIETFTDLDSTIWLDCRNSIFAFENLATSGKVAFPPGDYDNVFLLYLPNLESSGQFSNINDLVNSAFVQARGITVLAGAAARTMWNTERQNWITAHGGVVGSDGLLRFPFHAAP